MRNEAGRGGTNKTRMFDKASRDLVYKHTHIVIHTHTSVYVCMYILNEAMLLGLSTRATDYLKKIPSMGVRKLHLSCWSELSK